MDISIRRSREIPIRVYLPADKAAAPVVLFSHGLGGNREGSAFLGRHWASRGYAAVCLQHPGSDDSVWKDLRASDRALPGETERRNPNHHRAILAVTTAFRDAYLRIDEDARLWLDGDAMRSVLENDDQWQTK